MKIIIKILLPLQPWSLPYLVAFGIHHVGGWLTYQTTCKLTFFRNLWPCPHTREKTHPAHWIAPHYRVYSALVVHTAKTLSECHRCPRPLCWKSTRNLECSDRKRYILPYFAGAINSNQGALKGSNVYRICQIYYGEPQIIGIVFLGDPA